MHLVKCEADCRTKWECSVNSTDEDLYLLQETGICKKTGGTVVKGKRSAWLVVATTIELPIVHIAMTLGLITESWAQLQGSREVEFLVVDLGPRLGILDCFERGYFLKPAILGNFPFRELSIFRKLLFLTTPFYFGILLFIEGLYSGRCI